MPKSLETEIAALKSIVSKPLSLKEISALTSLTERQISEGLAALVKQGVIVKFGATRGLRFAPKGDPSIAEFAAKKRKEAKKSSQTSAKVASAKAAKKPSKSVKKQAKKVGK